MKQYAQFLKVEEFPGCSELSSKAYLYTISNKHGLELQVLNYGATIRALKVPDKNGNQVDIVLGFNTLEEYHKHTAYMGATVGRTAGRIADAKFTIEGQTFNVSKNENNKNNLHGGYQGFDKKFWTPIIDPLNPLKITMTCKSPDGEEGYPGNAEVSVSFELSAEKPAFTIKYNGTVDKACPIYLTNHSYFNLNGENSGTTIHDNEIMVNSSQFLPLKEDSIPTGEKATVENTPMDFRKMTAIGKRISDPSFAQFKITRGYDHPWLLDTSADYQCVAYGPSTGIEMKIKSNEPAVVVYTANYLDGKLKGKSGKPYVKHYAFTMETSKVENSINMKDFPNTVVKPGEKYEQITTFLFDVKK